MPTDASVRALTILRDGSQFQWYVIPFLLLVLYVYARRGRAPELERRLCRPGLLGHGLVQRDLERPGLPLHAVRAGLGRARAARPI